MYEAIEEGRIVPFYAEKPAGKTVLVLSPHPDDETLGCGATINMLKSQGSEVTVIFLTSGDKAEPKHELSSITYDDSHVSAYSYLREKEAIMAMKVLGIDKYRFLRYPDRGLLGHKEAIFDDLSLIIGAFDVLYCPSCIELNPDHRVTAMIAMKLQKEYGFSLFFYEVTVPFRPNCLVDITAVAKTKWKAMKAYKSQLRVGNYLDIVMSLNRFRTLTLGKSCKYAEAFIEVREKEQEMLPEWLSYKKEFNQ
ncbi:MAG: PIG-L family deacetylase [Candidatus Magnetoovum sp. WYHC-5]|nr:PIG-L family deacetylase [Candidatus Magnetoovum sp. WYHC-5]